jgi:hypothetical protein
MLSYCRVRQGAEYFDYLLKNYPLLMLSYCRVGQGAEYFDYLLKNYPPLTHPTVS